MHISQARPESAADGQPQALPPGDWWHEGARLILVADVVDRLAAQSGRPPWVVASEVLDCLAQRQPALFAAVPGADSKRWPEGFVWQHARAAVPAQSAMQRWRVTGNLKAPPIPAKPAVPLLAGWAGLVELWRTSAAKGRPLVEALRLPLITGAGPGALAWAWVCQVWPQLAPAAEVAAPSAQLESIDAAEAREIQPDGGQWPHKFGTPFTDAERCAMFEMLHARGYTGEQLAKLVGVTRQRIHEVIGPARPHGGLANVVAKDGAWRPPPELLARVGAPLQALQTAAQSLAAA